MEEYIQSQFVAKQTQEWEIERGEQSNNKKNNEKSTLTRRHLFESTMFKEESFRRKLNLKIQFSHLYALHDHVLCHLPFFPFPIFASAFHFHLFKSDEWVKKKNGCLQTANQWIFSVWLARCSVVDVFFLLHSFYFLPFFHSLHIEKSSKFHRVTSIQTRCDFKACEREKKNIYHSKNEPVRPKMMAEIWEMKKKKTPDRNRLNEEFHYN